MTRNQANILRRTLTKKEMACFNAASKDMFEAMKPLSELWHILYRKGNRPAANVIKSIWHKVYNSLAE